MLACHALSSKDLNSTISRLILPGLLKKHHVNKIVILGARADQLWEEVVSMPLADRLKINNIIVCVGANYMNDHSLDEAI